MATELKRMQQLFGSTADWAANNLVLLSGEMGFEDTGSEIKGKIGDGVSAWSALPYSLGPVATVVTVTEAMRGSSAGVSWSTEAGWILVVEGVGSYRVTFPTAAQADSSQTLQVSLNQGGAPGAGEIGVGEITAVSCLIDIRDSAGVNQDAGFSILRYYDV